jgi:hypothetical protein
MRRQELRDVPRVLHGLVMRSFSVSRERITSQPVMGSAIVPRMVRIPRTGAITLLGAQARARDEVAVAAHVLRERVEHQVGALPQRLLPEGPEERVVHHDERPLAVRLEGAPARRTRRCPPARSWDWPASPRRSCEACPAPRRAGPPVEHGFAWNRPRSRCAGCRTAAGCCAAGTPCRRRRARCARSSRPAAGT